jgi:hypothetical protein
VYIYIYIYMHIQLYITCMYVYMQVLCRNRSTTESVDNEGVVSLCQVLPRSWNRTGPTENVKMQTKA